MSDAIEIRCGSDVLTVVPAVHFRVAFAERVNELCRSLRPAAVAVELGPETAAAASGWLRELCGGAGGTRPLPCMLGLVKANRRIRASKREMAIWLQEMTGREFHELDPELLKKYLGYSAVRVLYLSPTDSIIEAMRCALELNVPLYGVDLEECAEREPHEKMIQDPTSAWGREDEYARRNAKYAHDHRDDEIDSRREFAMAARLKMLLATHHRVLFTCGLAHYLELERLLGDATIQPAPVKEVQNIQPTGFQRVVVSPLLAIYHLDVFPSFAQSFEEQRRPGHRKPRYEEQRETMAPQEEFPRMLKEAYRRHFVADERDQLNRSLEDWEARRDFENLMVRYCQVKQLVVPDLLTALSVSQGTMSPQFCATLADVLMRFDWATPDDFSDLQVLAPAPADSGEFIRAELSDKEGRHGRYFYIDPLPGSEGGGYKVRVPIPWKWPEKGEHVDPQRCGPMRSWNPRDYLKTALSARAIEITRGHVERPKTLPFEGSLLNGVDVKSSMRSQIRGDDRIYVREMSRPQRRNRPNAGDGFPVVWILRQDAEAGFDWSVTGENLSSFQAYVTDQPLFERVSRERGSFLVGLVDYSKREPAPHLQIAGLSPFKQPYQRSAIGMLIYQPPHLTYKQYGRWAESTRFERNPCRNDFSIDDLREHFRSDLGGVDPLAYDWPTALVLMAIPYSSGTVTVVTPDRYSLPRVVQDYAARYRVRINQAPLSFFPREEVKKMAIDYFVPSLKGGGGNDYPDELERVLGEKQTAYRDLVPRQWLDYGG